MADLFLNNYSEVRYVPISIDDAIICADQMVAKISTVVAGDLCKICLGICILLTKAAISEKDEDH